MVASCPLAGEGRCTFSDPPFLPSPCSQLPARDSRWFVNGNLHLVACVLLRKMISGREKVHFENAFVAAALNTHTNSSE